MRKIWLVFTHDFSEHVRQKGFLIALFSLPLFIGFSVGLGYFMQSQEISSDAVGYVDFSGIFTNPLSIASTSGRERVEILPYSDTAEVDELLKRGDLQAYFVIPNGYPGDNNIELYYFDEPGENAIHDFYDFLQLNLMKDYSQEIRNRVAIGTNSIIRTPDGSREFPENNPTVNMFIPLLIGLGFVMLLLISSGYLMSGFLDEKSNRTIEIIFTSISPGKLIVSKLVTMVAIGFTMLITWVAVGIIAFIFGSHFLEISWVREIEIDVRAVITILVVAFPSYVFAAALMLGIGFLLGNSQEAESIGPLFFVIAFIPLWFIVPITSDINGLIAILLSVLPIASILTIGLRGIFIEIPLWQLVLSVSVQLLLVTAALWLAVKTFRMGMLRSGSGIRLRELITKDDRLISERKS